MSTIEIRTDAVNCDLEISGAMPEIYADGHSHMMCVNNNIKLVLHSVTDAPLGECFEQRKGVVRLTIPTAPAIEMCRQILLNIKGSIDPMNELNIQEYTRVTNMLETININN